ncbi:MAG: SDR family oxidoreductase [Alphaproteobacteria bacterium]|jgi:NAD(P)-dependent dehydrogenase (short-subunit alcohol dehydrogenase family)|nr:SDR family oxidoreductase [Alphaproteobacteria bacterium]
MTDLNGKTALITGAASGIGLASVETFVEAGARVVAADIQDEKGAALEARFGADTVRYVPCDVTRPDDISGALSACEDSFGGLDILFNNAGAGGTSATVEEFDPEGFDATVALLLKSVFMGTHLALPHFKARGGGSVINTSSISAISAGYAPIVYSVCKRGVAHFSKIAAGELAKYGIRVNAILPGFIATSIFGTSLGLTREQADQMAEMVAQGGAKMQPVGRAGHGRDIAGMAAFLASDAAGFITGSEFVVDGGITTGPSYSWNEEEAGPILDALGITPEQAEQMAEAMRKG